MAFTRVKQFKDIELVYDATATLTVKFYTDISAGVIGSTLTLIKTVTFPVSTGRRTDVQPLDTTGVFPEGTLYKVVISSAAAFRLFGGIVRGRSIGTFVNGVNGETWETTEQGVGI